MEQKLSKKIFHICVIAGIIIAILLVVYIITWQYQVKGETNPPFKISKITTISSVDGTANEDATNKWNLSVNQNNDIYVYIEKNDDYSKTEIIESVVIDNININKEVEKGTIHTYKPQEAETQIFKNVQENEASEITYTGDLEQNIKNMKISNQGGMVVIRIANDNVSTYISNDAQEVDYSKLLSNTSVSMQDLKMTASFDLKLNLTSGKIYKTTINLDLPIDGVIENGTSEQEITENIILKRVENN